MDRNHSSDQKTYENTVPEFKVISDKKTKIELISNIVLL